MVRSSPKGIYRIQQPTGLENDVQVQDAGGTKWSIPESTYIARGYSPPINSLPWRDEYFAHMRQPS